MPELQKYTVSVITEITVQASSISEAAEVAEDVMAGAADAGEANLKVSKFAVTQLMVR